MCMRSLNGVSGISLVSLVVTIAVMVILAGVAFSSSLEMIGDSGDAKHEAVVYEENELIRALLMNAVMDRELVVGYALIDGSIEVLDEEGKAYGTNYHLIPGGDEEDMKVIRDKVGDSTLTPYRGITAPYVVDYFTNDFKRIEEIRFK